MVRNLLKKAYFLQFSDDLSKKSKSVKTIYIYASESSHYTLSEDLLYRLLHLLLSHDTFHEILVIKISKKMLTQLKFNKIFQFQILISPKQ